MPSQRRKIEFGELEQADFPAPVALGHDAIAGLELRAVDSALLDQELDPCFIAIDGEQRVVEIEQRQHVGTHDLVLTSI